VLRTQGSSLALATLGYDMKPLRGRWFGIALTNLELLRVGSIEGGIASFLCLFVLFVAIVLGLRQQAALGDSWFLFFVGVVCQ